MISKAFFYKLIESAIIRNLIIYILQLVMTELVAKISIPGTFYYVQLMTDSKESGVLYAGVLPGIHNQEKCNEILMSLNDIIQNSFSEQGLSTTYDLHNIAGQTTPFTRIMADGTFNEEWQTEEGEWNNKKMRTEAVNIIKGHIDEIRTLLPRSSKGGVGDKNTLKSSEDNLPARPISRQKKSSAVNVGDGGQTLESELEEAINSATTVITVPKEFIQIFASTLAKAHPAVGYISFDDYHTDRDPLYMWIHHQDQQNAISSAVPDKGQRDYITAEILSKIEAVYERQRESFSKRSNGNNGPKR